MIKFLYNTLLYLGMLFIAFAIINYHRISWEELNKIIFEKANGVIDKLNNINIEKKSKGIVFYSSDNRSIFICGWIDNKAASTVIEYLLFLEKTNGDISIYINSRGGYSSSIFQIVDVINTISCKVNTIGVGSCIDASVYLLISGTGNRLSYNSCIFSLRKSDSSKNKYDILYDKRINNILDKVNIPKFSCKRIFFISEDAKAYGIITKIKQ
jgi:ATP-dependent protease ClpP protease subunit